MRDLMTPIVHRLLPHGSTFSRWLLALMLLPVLYVASAGPMAPVLTRHTGNTGYR